LALDAGAATSTAPFPGEAAAKNAKDAVAGGAGGVGVVTG